MVSPFSDLIEDNEEFSLEHFFVTSNIEFKLMVQVLYFNSQFSCEFDSEVGDFNSNTFFEGKDGG